MVDVVGGTVVDVVGGSVVVVVSGEVVVVVGALVQFCVSLEDHVGGVPGSNFGGCLLPPPSGRC